MPRFVKGGPPGPGRPKGSRTKFASVREILKRIDTEEPEVIRKALLAGLKLPAPKNSFYVELVMRYILGRAPEFQPDAGRQPLVFLLSRGRPGEVDPIYDRRASSPVPEARRVVDVPALPAGHLPAAPVTRTVPPPPDDPDALVLV